jgi:hypothetical protein
MGAVIVLTVAGCLYALAECVRSLRARRAQQRAFCDGLDRVARAPMQLRPKLFDQEQQWADDKVAELTRIILAGMPEAPRLIDADPQWADTIDLRDDWTVN